VQVYCASLWKIVRKNYFITSLDKILWYSLIGGGGGVKDGQLDSLNDFLAKVVPNCSLPFFHYHHTLAPETIFLGCHAIISFLSIVNVSVSGMPKIEAEPCM
jgi:hypothetical protein